MKTAVITGGNSGVGKATATELAKKGYRVIIHGRDAQKTQRAAAEIRSDSGNENVEIIVADVSTLAGMKQLAEGIRKKTDTIDALVLSTGVIMARQVITADGLEAGFAIQYLSRFAMVQLLMPELTKSGNARIVEVGAPKLANAKIHFDDIALKDNFTMMRAMGQEMYAIHLFTQEFAKRHPGKEIVMNMLHVGIAKTGIAREANFMVKMLVKIFGTSPEKACKNIVYLASDPQVDFSGYFLGKPGKPQVKQKIAYDAETASKLYDLSLQLIAPIR